MTASRSGTLLLLLLLPLASCGQDAPEVPGGDSGPGAPGEGTTPRQRGGVHPGARVKYNVSKVTYSIPLQDGRTVPREDLASDSAEAGVARGGARISARLTGDDPVLPDSTRFHVWRYVADTAGTVEVVLSSADFDAFLLVGREKREELEFLAEDDDGADGTDARVRVPVRAGEVYHLVATSVFPGEEGVYQLRVAPSR